MKIPVIKYPVYGIATPYNFQISDKPGSKELKYQLYGVLFWDKGPVEITVLNIFVKPDNPYHVYIQYADSRDGKVHEVFANGIAPINVATKQLTLAQDVDYLIGLHHGSALFIRYPNKKTFIAKASKTSRTIRGNAYYRIYGMEPKDNKYVFDVVNENNPLEHFQLTANQLVRGTWHRDPGSLCPVPGVDPSER